MSEPREIGGASAGSVPSRDRLRAYALSTLLLAAVLYPAFLAPGQDSFPLSTYPMFGKARPKRVEVMSALALGADSTFELPVPPSYIANAEAMQALQTLRKSVAAGRASARALCERIAQAVVENDEPAFASARRIALVTTRIDAMRFLSDAVATDRERRDRIVHVRCAIPGRASKRAER